MISFHEFVELMENKKEPGEKGYRAKEPFSKAKLGEGGRFEACVRKMKKREDIRDPEAACAAIGRRTYGKRRFQKLAKRGK